MKKTLHILGIVTVIAGLMIILSSCGSKQSQDGLVLSSSVDTSGLAEFQSMKAQKEQKTADMNYAQGYKDAMATKTVTTTRVVYKPVATQPVTVRKKGWSKAAKGTAIGATTGALAGALISKKNRLVGGIIGGLIGGGAGYGIGRGMDKQDGRY